MKNVETKFWGVKNEKLSELSEMAITLILGDLEFLRVQTRKPRSPLACASIFCNEEKWTRFQIGKYWLGFRLRTPSEQVPHLIEHHYVGPYLP